MLDFHLSETFTKKAFVVLCFLLLCGLAKSFANKQIIPEPILTITPRPVVKESVEVPVRLKIPKIEVDAAIEYVGVTAQGAMAVPQNIADVGWFNLGPRPGESGNAVAAGHLNGHHGEKGVFDKLHTLSLGDIVYVEDGQGRTMTFVVSTIRRYDPQADASEVFKSSDGQAHFNLITCGGAWDKAKQSYTNRLVIFTDRQSNI